MFKDPRWTSPTSIRAPQATPNDGCLRRDRERRIGPDVPMMTEDRALAIVSSLDGERWVHTSIEGVYERVRLHWIHAGATRSDAGRSNRGRHGRSHPFGFLVSTRLDRGRISRVYLLPKYSISEKGTVDFTLVVKKVQNTYKIA